MKLARTAALAILAFAASSAALAVQPKPTETVLNFPLINLPLINKSSIEYSHTVGGKAIVSTGSGQLSFSLLGYLGVESGGLFSALDPSLSKGESITVTFDQAVSLTGWDVDDFNITIILPEGTDKFALSVDGGAAKELALSTHTPTSPLIGKSFTFGYAGDNYFIDQLRFSAATPVPELSTLAQMGLGLGLIGVMMNRRQRKAA